MNSLSLRATRLESRSVVVLREHEAPEEEPDHSVAASLAAQVGNG